MAIVRCTAIINHVSGEDADASRNVWHFTTSTGTTISGGDAAVIGGKVGDFYNSIAALLSPAVSRAANGCRVEVATVNQASAGPEDDTVSALVGTVPFQLFGAAAAATPLPNETAACLSFAGAQDEVPEESGLIRPRSRRRGRVFLGPFNTSVIEAGTNGEPRMKATSIATILDAYEALSGDDDAGTTNFRHVVYSRAAASTRVVDEAWMDVEFDNVRRRSASTPQVRIARAIAQPPFA
jgi:hypothetical protein